MAILEVLIKKSFSDIYFNVNYLSLIHNSFLTQINSITNVYEERNNDGNINYILIDPNLIKNTKLIKNVIIENNLAKLYLPKLPEYNWSVNKDILKKEIIFNQYFIS